MAKHTFARGLPLFYHTSLGIQPHVCYNKLMNNLEYLNHISQTSRPVARRSAGPRPGLIPKILLGGLLGLALIGVIIFIVNLAAPKFDNYLRQVYYRTTSLKLVLDNYNRSIKSSDLRAIANSLSGTLTGATSSLEAYYNQIGEKTGKYTNEFLAEEAPAFTELEVTLQNAKLNGILDRIYIVQAQLQVSLLLAVVAQTRDRTHDAYLIQTLDTYAENLTLIKQKLEAYSSPGV